jgi:UDP-glucose 4-epimerase
MQEMNVIGTMQLLAACQKSDTVERVVVRSTTAVYGCGASDPAVFTEGMHPHDGSQAGYAKDAAEVEGYVRGFARRRSDVDVSVLRLATILGPTIDNAFTRYLTMPVVPVAIGFDPRMQLLQEDDAVEALRLATTSRRPGVVNVAGDGVLLLSQVLRRAGRLRVPVPGAALGLAGAIVRNTGVVDVTAEDARYLNFGRVVDTTKLHTEFGFTPRHSTGDAIESFLRGASVRPRLALAAVGVGSRLLQARRESRRPAMSAT